MIISKTPLRISFAGGGSDFEGYYKENYGAVVSTAINKHIYVYLTQKFDAKIRLVYWRMENVDKVESLKHNVMRECIKLAGVKQGINTGYMSELLPAHEGTGLGASSSLAVGALNAFYALNGVKASPSKLAGEACRVEIDILGHPIGKQDQYAAAYGGFNYIKFGKNGKVSVNPIVCRKETLEKLNRNLILFYTNMDSLSSKVLPEQKKNISANSVMLDKMVGLANKMRDDLENNDINDFGNILHENWLMKKNLSRSISNRKIDSLYNDARVAGAIGGKILGSGGGGFLLLYCPEDKQPKVRKALKGLKETKFRFEFEGSKIIHI